MATCSAQNRNADGKTSKHFSVHENSYRRRFKKTPHFVSQLNDVVRPKRWLTRAIYIYFAAALSKQNEYRSIRNSLICFAPAMGVACKEDLRHCGWRFFDRLAAFFRGTREILRTRGAAHGRNAAQWRAGVARFKQLQSDVCGRGEAGLRAGTHRAYGDQFACGRWARRVHT